MLERTLLRVGPEAIDVSELLSFVGDPAAGATCLFLGAVRDHSDAGDVTGLQYEAWDDLAVERLQSIAGEMFDKWPLRKVALVHRVGDLSIGDVSAAVVCSAGHRAEAFEACRHGIERIKHDVPVWKKEALATGEGHWVAGS